MIQRQRSTEDVEFLQENLNQLYQWGKEYNIQFKRTKFQVLRYGTNETIKEETMYFTEDMKHTIEQVNVTKYLGVLVTYDAKYDENIDTMCKKVRQKSGWVLRTSYTRNLCFMKSILKSLIQPHIDYCSQLWMPPQGQKLEKVERLLKSWTSRIPTMRNLTYWQRLKEMKMYSEQRRLERYRVIYTWKVLQGLVPNPGIVEAQENEYLGRRCQIPRLNHRSRMSTQTMKESSFQTNGPQLFISLSKCIRNMKKFSEEEFKEQ